MFALWENQKLFSGKKEDRDARKTESRFFCVEREIGKRIWREKMSPISTVKISFHLFPFIFSFKHHREENSIL